MILMINLDASANWGTWGIHINVWSNQSGTPNFPEWAKPFQKNKWQERGVVIWDEKTQQITRCYAEQMLKVLQDLNATDVWKQDGYVVGVPAYRIVLPSGRQKKKKEPEQSKSEEKTGEGWVMTETINLTPDQTALLFGFLEKSVSALEKLAEIERAEARERLGKAYKMILEWGRERRERQAANGEANKLPISPVEKKVMPTSIPAGQYFSIDQVAEICRTTPKGVKKWVEKGHLLPITIPGVGMLVELQELNRFLEKIGQPIVEGCNFAC
jgi:hypothetical protein